MARAGQEYFYHYNVRGDVTLVTDASQQKAVEYLYDDYGRINNKTGTLNQPFQYSTKRFDPDTGLAYFGYRFYAPAINKWIARDPLHESGGINLYGYVGGNPLNYVDPFGLEPDSGCVAACTIGGGIIGGGIGYYGLGLLGGLLGGGGGTLVGPEGTIAGGIAGAVAGSRAGGAGGAAAGSAAGNAAGRMFCRDNGEDNKEDCRKEKQGCIELCSEIAEKKDSDRRHVWGGSISQCVQNCLPTRCGGEGMWKGFK